MVVPGAKGITVLFDESRSFAARHLRCSGSLSAALATPGYRAARQPGAVASGAARQAALRSAPCRPALRAVGASLDPVWRRA
jgi:hypothetical protein